MIDWLKKELKQDYEMSNLEEIHYCLEMEFVRDCAKKFITMSKSKYTKEILKWFNIEEYKPIGVPLEVNLRLIKLMNKEFIKIEDQM